MENIIIDQLNVLKKCVNLYHNDKKLTHIYLTVDIDRTGQSVIYFLKNFTIIVAHNDEEQSIIKLSNIKEVKQYIDNHIPLVIKITIRYKVSDTLVYPVYLYNDGDILIGCRTKNIRLKSKLISRLVKSMYNNLVENEDILEILHKVVKYKEENEKLELQNKQLENKIKKYDQTQLNDRLINLIEYSKLNPKLPQQPKPPPRRKVVKELFPPEPPPGGALVRQSSRNSPGKEPGFFRGMAFGNNVSSSDSISRKLMELIRNTYYTKCENETTLNVALSQLRETCRINCMETDKKIKDLLKILGIRNSINNTVLQRIMNTNAQLKLYNKQLLDLLEEKEELFENTSNRAKISTSYTNKTFNAYKKPISNFGKKKVNKINKLKLNRLKSNLKNLLKSK